MTKLHITAAAILVSAAVLLAGCSERGSVPGEGTLSDAENSTLNVSDSGSGDVTSGAEGSDASGGNDGSSEPEKPSEPEKTYTEKIKERYNVNVNVEFTRERLKFTEFAHKESGTWDEYMPVDDNRVVIASSRVSEEIRMYLADKREYVTLINTQTDPDAGDGDAYLVKYVNKDYAVISRVNYDKKEADLCVIDLNKDGYPCETVNFTEYPFIEGIQIVGDTLYFGSYDSFNVKFGDGIPNMYKYKIGSGKAAELVLKGGVPYRVFNGDLIYWTQEDGAAYITQTGPEGTPTLRSLSGASPVDGEHINGSAKLLITDNSVFKFDNESEELTNFITGEVILSAGGLDGSRLTAFGECSFGFMLGEYSKDSFGYFNDLIFNAHTNELLVISETDRTADFYRESWNDGFCLYSGNSVVLITEM